MPVVSVADEAAVLFARASEHHRGGRTATAARVLDAASRVVDLDRDAELAARIALARATYASELHGLGAGLDALDAAEQLIDRANVPALAASLHDRRGYMLVRGGDLDAGLSELDSAVALLADADSDTRYSILLNRGTALLFAGAVHPARTDLRAAVQQARKRGDRLDELQATHNLGYAEYLSGHLARALTLMQDAAALDPAFDGAVGLLDQARVLTDAGLLDDATRSLERAEAAFRAQRLWADVGQVRVALAQCAFLSGRFDRAAELAQSARRHFLARANTRWLRECDMLIVHAAVKSSSVRASHLTRIEAVHASSRGPDERAARLVWAEALLGSGDSTRAAALLAGSRPPRTTASLSDTLHERLVRARLAAALGDRRDLRRHLAAGLRALADFQSSFGSVDLQTSSAVHGRELASMYVDLAVDIGRPRAVFEAIERTRAVSSRIVPVSPPEDPVTAGLLSQLRFEIDGVRTVQGAVPPEAMTRIAELENAISSRSWRHDGVGTVAPVVSIVDVGNRLSDSGATVLSFVRSRGRFWVLRLGSDRASLHRLAAVERVDELVIRVRSDMNLLARKTLSPELIPSLQRSMEGTLAELDAILLDSLGRQDGPVVIVPSGRLAAVPWGALPRLRGVPSIVAASVSAWMRSAAEPAPADFAVPLAVVHGPRLRHARREVDAVGSIWSMQARDHPKVSWALQNAAVVHIAAHGRHHDENPMFSALELDEGSVFAYELVSSSDISRHVILSSCETGRSTVRPGDEALGLANVLTRCGVVSTIASVGEVDDESAYTVMTDYHRRLAHGVDSASALAAATESGTSPFVCFGGTWSRGA